MQTPQAAILNFVVNDIYDFVPKLILTAELGYVEDFQYAYGCFDLEM